MKVAYSEFNYFKRWEVDAAKNLDPLTAIKNLKAAGIKNNREAIRELSCIKLSLTGNQMAKEGKCTHYFFSGNGFYNWLEKAAPPITDEHMDMVDQLCGDDKAIMLHYQGGLAPCYLVFTAQSLDFDMQDCGKRLVINSGKNNRLVYASPSYETGDYEIDRPVKIVSASIAYILAFPEMVKDGIPDDAKHPNHYRLTKNKTVGMSLQIIERDGPTPHFRSGHFRHLVSDRYKHKRGQTVFVRGSFVKGQAKTVLNP